MNGLYANKYEAFSTHTPFLVKAISEEAGHTVNSVASTSGTYGVEALMHVLIDSGHRGVLIKALNSPAIEGWVRQSMEKFLYGSQNRKVAVLCNRTVH